MKGINVGIIHKINQEGKIVQYELEQNKQSRKRQRLRQYKWRVLQSKYPEQKRKEEEKKQEFIGVIA